MSEQTDGKLFDKTGREIMVGDLVKVFHFVGRRNKHYFMYKQVMGVRHLGKEQTPYFWLSHLNMKSEGERDSGYHMPLNGEVLDRYEIVQNLGVEGFEDRPRIPTTPNTNLGEQG